VRNTLKMFQGLLPLMAGALIIVGCASAPGDYPSLALRQNERVTGALEAPRAAPFVPVPATPATLESLAQLTASASLAHEAFLGAARTAAPVVARAGSSAVGSENWALAQVAIADLEARRSVAMVALADIDRLYVEAVTQGGDPSQIEPALKQVEAQVAEQDAKIASLLALSGG